MYPRVCIDKKKLTHNAKVIIEKCHQYGQKIAISTKLVGGNCEIANIFVMLGTDYIADSRIENLKRLQECKIPKILLRIPALSQAREAISVADITLHSSLHTLKAFESIAFEMKCVHNILLMVDLGDVREGIWYENREQIRECSEFVEASQSLTFLGIATNLTCFGGVLPSENNMREFSQIVYEIEKNIERRLEIKSFGNSNSITFLKFLNKCSNQVRIGEAIFMGRETAHGKLIEETFQDIFELECEVIEVEKKPSRPSGNIGRDAFGNIPVFLDRGMRKRAIIAIGKQDISYENMKSFDKGIEILGSSSDHIVLDIEACERDINVGDILKFSLNYAGVLALYTSDYVEKILCE